MEQWQIDMLIRHERVLFGTDGAPGALEQLRRLGDIPDKVAALGRSDVMQSAISDALWRLAMTAGTVVITLLITYLFARAA